MIYLDNAATTRPSEGAMRALSRAAECFYNPSSLHKGGTEAEGLLRKAREETAEEKAERDYFAAVAAEFLPFIEGATLVAHNARFDLGFLQESLNRCGLPLWHGRTLDTVRLMRTVYPGLPSYRLQVLR